MGTESGTQGLHLLAEREVILVYATPGSGKSFSVARLCQDGEEQGFNVVVIDRDRGLAKAIKEVYKGKMPQNLEYYLVKDQQVVYDAVKFAQDMLGAKDWLVFENLGGFWDLAQDTFSDTVFNEDSATHSLEQRAIAQRLLDAANITDLKSEAAQKVLGRAQGYGGFEGMDWVKVKAIHNKRSFDRVAFDGVYNVLSTSKAHALDDREIKQKKHPMFEALGLRPEGETGQVGRHDTVAFLYTLGGKYLWQTDLGNLQGKERGGRAFKREQQFGIRSFTTGAPILDQSPGFVRTYMLSHGLWV